ncbi:hypothetical protein QQS21_009785 [Conoideocrella luteorostrata]|uniref:Uncharacterized protein n=1 Tax=Conoideocrella luteorostrata TaxID=1105319 RepID=A0AAJ0CGK4_9HYPO|nr:hypothetical protein QQS21_009785 [Conoideocrella luteorostrata]
MTIPVHLQWSANETEDIGFGKGGITPPNNELLIEDLNHGKRFEQVARDKF